MPEPEKKSYPMIAGKVWWGLGERFKRTIPATVSSSYIASVLSMSDVSARNNVLPALRGTGLIDDTGKPTDLAVKWRDDVHYKEACGTIIKDAYPQELIDLGADSKHEVQRWFATHCRVGASAAGKMAALYLLLQEADPSKANGPSEGELKPHKSVTGSAKPKVDVIEKARKQPPESQNQQDKKVEGGQAPQIHFDIQIHISPESTPEQIEAIFASMAKHLKDLR
ncbi:MAG: DUF5343 domain-containing protein [Proteobacteria bacterium]|nr:DUF5343 domain-containing protein [Pseudomonadota bacterium]